MDSHRRRFLCLLSVLIPSLWNGLPRTSFPDLDEKSTFSYITSGSKYSKKVALTFDDGWYMYNDATESILDTFKKYELKSTFFVVGCEMKKSKELWQRAIDEGHILMNHTQTHRCLDTLSKFGMKYELFGWEDSYDSLERGNPLRILRFPANAGANNLWVYEQLCDLGFYYGAGWSIDSNDWKRAADTSSNVQYVKDNILPYLDNGKIVLQHCLPSSASALEDIILHCLEHNLEIVKLTELPGTPVYIPKKRYFVIR
ncbi:polysaccharide deacetylase family protein [Candidatus Woesearchaeota archaeon]|nr:polysaccharide deacetylase family protein [Candidatus Woesearchaeota archaeon]